MIYAPRFLTTQKILEQKDIFFHYLAFAVSCMGAKVILASTLIFLDPWAQAAQKCFPPRVCYTRRNSLAAALTTAFTVHLDQTAVGENCCTADIIWGQDERHLVLFLWEDLLSYPVSLHSSGIGLVGQKPIASFPVVFRYRSINATAPKWHLIPGHQIARSWGPLICLKLPACISILFLK